MQSIAIKDQYLIMKIKIIQTSLNRRGEISQIKMFNMN